jgi:hypothetical protein
VLQINVIELEADSRPFANDIAHASEHLDLTVDSAEYLGKKVLATLDAAQGERAHKTARG